MAKSKLWTKEYVITTCVNFLVAINFYLLMIIVSEYAMTKFDASESLAGFSASIFVIGALVARVLVGRFIVQVGYKKMLMLGAIFGTVFTLAYFVVGSLSLLLAIRFLHGAAFGIISTSSATITADIVPKDRQGEGIGYYSLSQTLATAIGPFLGMFLSRNGSYSTLFAACALAAGIAVIIIPFMSLRNRPIPKQQSHAGFKLTNYIEPKAVPISLIALLIYLCYSSIVSFLSVYSKQIGLETAAGFFFVVYAIAVLSSRPFVGKLFDKKGEHVIMYPAIVVFGIGLLLFSQSHFALMLLCAAAFVGFGFGAIQASAQAIAVKLTAQNRLGLASSTFFMFCDVGMGIGPVLVGLLIPLAGYRGVYAIAAFIAFSCIGLYYLLHHKRTRENPSD